MSKELPPPKGYQFLIKRGESGSNRDILIIGCLLGPGFKCFFFFLNFINKFFFLQSFKQFQFNNGLNGISL